MKKAQDSGLSALAGIPQCRPLPVRRILLTPAVFLFAGLLSLNAQDSVTSEPDSLSLRIKEAPVLLFHYYPSSVIAPRLHVPTFETAAQKAAKAEIEACRSVMESMDFNMRLVRVPELPPIVFRVVSLSLSNPFAIPEGCVPMMNHSFPFIYARIPGQEPYFNPYTSDLFPKCVDTEYDAATGTYRQVMVDWGDYLKKTSGGYDFTVTKQPVPKMPDNPADRFVH